MIIYNYVFDVLFFRFFIATLVSGIFTIIQMLVVSCYVFSQYFANKDNLKYLEKTDSGTVVMAND